MKKHNIIITVLFTVFIGIMAILTAFLPKQEISVNEKRVLAKFPQFSFDKLFSGKWERDFEGYISDHFPARDFFAGADAYYMLLTGKNGSNGIYKGKNGYLFQTPVKANQKTLKDNIEAVNAFADKTNIETKMLIVPSAGFIMSDWLPVNHEEYRDDEIIKNEINNSLNNVESIDILGEFMRDREAIYVYGDRIYYKTDHHWTSYGAYLAYVLWCRGEGIKPRIREDYTITQTDGFYGTSYSKSALWLTKPDTIETWEYPINVTVTIDNTEYSSMFFKEHLTENDKYPVYLDGNHAFLRIVNHDNPSGKKILLIKDSYAHCFAPFMAENCSQIDMVDLRYYFDPVSDLTNENNYDEVLVLYGISNMCETKDLSILQ